MDAVEHPLGSSQRDNTQWYDVDELLETVDQEVPGSSPGARPQKSHYRASFWRLFQQHIWSSLS